MKLIGLIPARGGSKGIPRKNLRMVGGKPLMGHKISQAIESLCNEVWVSTDDAEISKVSESFGANVINRPVELSTDESSTDSMLIHAVHTLNPSLDDIIVLLQATSPLLKIESLNKCIQTLIDNPKLNSVITVRESHPFMWETLDGRNWEPNGHSRDKRPRRQDLAQGGWETGGCYAIRVNAIIEQQNRYPRPTGCVGVTHLESIDLDTFDDLNIIEEILS
jgi:N-acylneuraminate cytidylyltransferase